MRVFVVENVVEKFREECVKNFLTCTYSIIVKAIYKEVLIIMSQDKFALLGNICYSTGPNKIHTIERGYLVVSGDKIVGAFDTLPDEYSGVRVEDYGEALIIPGMTDLHVHAPQFPFRGIGMDLELLDWLNTYTFPEEAKYSSIDYAEKIYEFFTQALKASPITRAVIFSTIHVPATRILFDKLEASGLISYVGKVNMDRNSPDDLRETTTTSLADTELLINEAKNYKRTHAILTPRFTPSCSDDLMKGLGDLKAKYDLPVQSHLCENPSEVELVRELCPTSKNYADTYDRFGLLDDKAIMAHCVYLNDDEIELMKVRKSFVAHCPQSNINLASGIAPVKKFLELGINVGLGTDIAAGASLSMFRAITDAIGVSKLYWRLVDEDFHALTFSETFYMATMGGGKFFGQVGSFLPGYEADVLVLDEKNSGVRRDNLLERLEQTIYLADENVILIAKYVAGKKL